MKSKRAFTLIELLVVIAIIGILATVSIISLTNARAKSRDAKRAGDIKQIQTALELFFNDNNRYPTAEEWSTNQLYSTSTAGTSTYMQVIPGAPTPADGNCTTAENSISYAQGCGGTSYSISFCLGNTTGTLTPGPKCLTPGGILDVNCESSCGHPFVDCRDNQSYATVQIGTQCWLAENLNVGSQICTVGTTCATEPDDSFDHNSVEKYCYSNDEAQCDVYGGLYSWSEMLGLPNKCKDGEYTPNADFSSWTHATDSDCDFNVPIQGICPDGWHVPSYIHGQPGQENANDWTTLVINYLTVDGQGGAGTEVGGKIKEAGTTHWTTPNTGATNSSGFTALGTGFRSSAGNYSQQGNFCYFFTTYLYYGNAWVEKISYNSSGVGGGDTWGERNNAWPVRCVKDN